MGLLTGMRLPSTQGAGFAVALNYRQIDPGLLGYLKPLWSAACRRWPAAALIRHVLKTRATYDEARADLCALHTMAPCYLTLAGTRPGEGCIMARNTRGVDKLLELPRQAGGAIIQTNIDHDVRITCIWEISFHSPELLRSPKSTPIGLRAIRSCSMRSSGETRRGRNCAYRAIPLTKPRGRCSRRRRC